MSGDQTLLDMLEKISKKSVSEIREDDFYEEKIEYKKITKIDRDVDYIITGSSWATEIINEKILDTSKVINRIKKEHIFSKLILHLTTNYELKKDQTETMLNKYLTHILKNGYSQNDLTQFLEDVNGIPPSWYNYIKLRGIVVKNDVLVGKYHFREPKKQDLNLIINSHFLGPIHFPFPHAILEFDNDHMLGHKNQEDIINLIEILKLFTLSAISYDGYRMKTRSFNASYFGGELFTGRERSDKPVFHLKKDDNTNLFTFINFMTNKIGNVVHQKTNTPINIAFQRYNDSLVKLVGPEEKLTSAIMGLEALFLTGGQDLSYQLRIKAAKLLGYLNEPPEEVLSTLKKSYTFRSKFIHGSILREKDTHKVNALLDLCRNYLRKVLIYWFYHNIKSEKEKTRFLSDIEKSLINDHTSHKIKMQASEMINNLPGVF